MSPEATMPSLGASAPEWPSVPIKYVATINATALGDSTDPDRAVRYIDISSVSSLGEILEIETMPFSDAPSRARRIVRHGDTIVSTVRTYLRAVAPIPADDENLVVSTGFAVVSPNQGLLEPRFASFWLRSTPFVDEVCARSVGVSYPAVNASEVGALPIPLPPLPTQKAIADFLDRKTAAIEALIEKKQKLLGLLAEKRAALINQAVTKGLDPGVPMKDSGIPWIGEIPAHWEVRPSRYLVDSRRPVMYGIVLPGPHVEGGIPIVKANNCRPGRLVRDRMKCTTPEIESRYVRSRLREDDVVIAIRGSVGSTAIVPKELAGANLTQDAARLAPGPKLTSIWLRFLTMSPWFSEFITPRITGSTVKGVNIWDLARVPIPDVPMHEQVRIAAALDTHLHPIDTGSDATIKSIARLREYRQALITAAVTGQLDIPEEAA